MYFGDMEDDTLEPFRKIKLSVMRKESLSPVPKKEDILESGEYICYKCGKVYKWHYTLCRHLKYECGKQARFGCPMCPYRAKRKDNLKYHVEHCHKEEKKNTRRRKYV